MANSVLTPPVEAPPENRPSPNLAKWQTASVFVILAWLYGPVLYHLALQWKTDPNYQHGWFVPLFVAFVVWQDRRRLSQIEPAPSWGGIALIAFAMGIHALGQMGAEIFLPRVSFLLCLAGLIVLFQGWAMFRALLFPWACLFLMVPIPELLLQHVTFPLQLLASRLSSNFLPLCNVPVFREGNLIELPNKVMNVAEACSGIRSLLTMVTLAVIYGYLMDRRNWVRLLLVVCSVPIAVLANGLRIVITGLIIQYVGVDKAEGFYHTFSGLLIFVVALAMFFALHSLITLVWSSASPELDFTPIRAALSAWVAKPVQPAKGSSSRFLALVLLLLITAIGLQVHSLTEVFPPHRSLASFPLNIGQWIGESYPLDQDTLDVLKPTEYALSMYTNVQTPQPPIGLFLAYFATQRAGETIHSPSHCLPGAGWAPVSRQIVMLKFPDGSLFPVNRFIVAKGKDRQLVLYWFQAHGHAVASELWAKYYLTRDSIQMHRSDGSLVRFTTDMLPDETPEGAQERLMKFGDQVLPLLDSYIPR